MHICFKIYGISNINGNNKFINYGMPCLNFGFYLMLIAYLQVETDTEKTESANTLPFAVPFHGSAYFGMGA